MEDTERERRMNDAISALSIGKPHGDAATCGVCGFRVGQNGVRLDLGQMTLYFHRRCASAVRSKITVFFYIWPEE